MRAGALMRVWRAHTARVSEPMVEADQLLALSNAALSDEARDAALAQVAESARNADLLRVLHSLQADAATFERDLTALQRTHHPALVHRVAKPQRWLALAACVALAGVVGLMLRAPVSVAPSGDAVVDAQATGAPIDEAAPGTIMVASFDGVATAESQPAESAIFRGDFDS